MKFLRLSPSISSMICSSKTVPRVVTARAWVSPRVNRAEPWVRGRRSISQAIGRMSFVPRPSVRRRLSSIEARTTAYSTSSRTSPRYGSCFSGIWAANSRLACSCTVLMALPRSILPFTKQASSSLGLAQPATAAFKSGASSSSASRGSLGSPTALASSSWMRHSSRIVRCASSIAWIMMRSGISLAPPSTMVMPSAVPATMMSSVQRSIWS